ncbi:hypothetical protein [Paenibacillus whitsoniae]|uniref:STAS/SEC14 domain-containing protein n=1 Tax=Paenibacillus whitsoniae TaxID=2496558 RepID=A0A3S0CFN9_9BACL|nr:hypothetical protein [Paenibacillus whitsoniae]RTE11647.1 hypothetical protein EJQ19_01085 [Paenibacillus whitsoniae]
MEGFFETKHGVVAWNDELQSVMMEWNGFAYGEEFQTILMKGAELLHKKKGSKVLMDTRNGAAIKAEDKAWIGEIFVKKAYESGLRQIALVQPRSVVAKLSINRTVEGLGTLPYLQENFSDWDEAVNWLSASSPKLQVIG